MLIYSQLIHGLVLCRSSARFGLTDIGVSSQARHDAYTLREDKPSIDAHTKVEENWSHVPYSIEEAIISEYFITLCKLRKIILEYAVIHSLTLYICIFKAWEYKKKQNYV